MKFYMFRTVDLSIIRSLFVVHSTMVYVIQVCRQLSSRTRMELQFHPGHVIYRVYSCACKVGFMSCSSFSCAECLEIVNVVCITNNISYKTYWERAVVGRGVL